MSCRHLGNEREDGKSPGEMFGRRRIDISKEFRVWGCRVIARKPIPWRDGKLDKQAVDGINLGPILAQPQSDSPIQRGRGIGFESARLATWTTDRFKLVADLTRTPRGEPTVAKLQLFDLVADPGETNDLAADSPEVVTRLGAELARWRKAIRKRS